MSGTGLCTWGMSTGETFVSILVLWIWIGMANHSPIHISWILLHMTIASTIASSFISWASMFHSITTRWMLAPKPQKTMPFTGSTESPSPLVKYHYHRLHDCISMFILTESFQLQHVAHSFIEFDSICTHQCIMKYARIVHLHLPSFHCSEVLHAVSAILELQLQDLPYFRVVYIEEDNNLPSCEVFPGTNTVAF
jgi:hypothetical protein